MGIEDEAVNGIKQNKLMLLSANEIDTIESKLTSASSKIATKSLATVLTQALTADDTEQIDWVLAQKDCEMIQNTVGSLKEHKVISCLFKQIIVKFQQDNKQQSVLLWLKNLVAVHWLTLIKQADKEDIKSFL